jgi:hypothetical protein
VSVPATGGSSSTWRTDEGDAARPAARRARANASPRRFRPGKHNRGTRITFRLAAPGRVVFVVRGPAPSCDVAGRFAVRGRRGVNNVRFKGRIGRRTLPAGTYVITARSRDRTAVRRLVVVLLPRRGSARVEHLRCEAQTEQVAAVPGADNASPPPAAQPGKKTESGVLPAVERKLRSVPQLLPSIPKPPMPSVAGTEPGSGPWFVGMVALALLALSGLGLVVYVLHFIRKPHSA